VRGAAAGIGERLQVGDEQRLAASALKRDAGSIAP